MADFTNLIHDPLAKAMEAGVNALAFDCVIKPNEMVIGETIPVKL